MSWSGQPGVEARGFRGLEQEAGGGEAGIPDNRLLLDLVSGVVGGPVEADGAAHHRHVHRDDRWRQVSHLQKQQSCVALGTGSYHNPWLPIPSVRGPPSSSQPRAPKVWSQLGGDSLLPV